MVTFQFYKTFTIPSKKSSAQLGSQVNYAKTRNGCIKWYVSLFKEIILPRLDEFQTEIEGSHSKLSAFKVSRGQQSKVAKLLIMAPGAENMIWFSSNLVIIGFNHLSLLVEFVS